MSIIPLKRLHHIHIISHFCFFLVTSFYLTVSTSISLILRLYHSVLPCPRHSRESHHTTSFRRFSPYHLIPASLTISPHSGVSHHITSFRRLSPYHLIPALRNCSRNLVIKSSYQIPAANRSAGMRYRSMSAGMKNKKIQNKLENKNSF